ncbi:MAG: Ig-like domain-containing protein [Deltaproteobacteria bacterium]|nr:Ig-like domain-containing protein [Deltaproteobacteria bacterium]
MRKYILLFVVLFTALACDDSTSSSSAKVSPSESTIESTGVLFDVNEQKLYTDITVTVNDEDGNPLAGRYVSLQTSDATSVEFSDDVATDIEGKAAIRVYSQHIADVTFDAFVSSTEGGITENSIQLENNVTVSFNLSVSMEISEKEFDVTGATFNISILISDSEGAVEGAEVILSTENDLTLNDTELTTDSEGIVITSAQSSYTGYMDINVEVTGIFEQFSVSFLNAGPEIGGSINLDESFAYMLHPTVTAVAINIGTGALDVLGYLDNIDPVDFSDDSDTWSLYLPVVSPENWRFDIDGGTATVMIPLVFDDLNEDGIFSDGEYYVAAKTTGGTPVFIGPDDPENAPVSGWSLMEELSDSPVFIDWEENSLSLDMMVLNAPVRNMTVSGTVNDTQHSGKRIGFYAVSFPDLITAAESGNPFLVLLDSSSSQMISDVESGATPAWENEIPDLGDVLDEQTISDWAQVIDLGSGNVIRQVLILPVYYTDTDSSGDFTAGDILLGMAAPPPGGKWNITYITEYPEEYILFLSDTRWLHYGYNWWASPAEYEINTFIPDGADFLLTVSDGSLEDLTDAQFAVYAADASDEDLPVATGLYTTDSTDVARITSCSGCDLVESGMVFRVTESYEDTVFIDWSESFDIAPF